MKVTIWRGIIITLLLGCGAASFGYPSFYGDAGIVQAPTADTTPNATMQFAVDYTMISQYDVDTTIYPFRVSYGAGKKSELFATYTNSEGDEGIKFKNVGFGAKIALMKEDLYGQFPGFAIGARFNRQDREGEMDITEGYAVLKKTLIYRGDGGETSGFALSLHAGTFYSRYEMEILKPQEFWTPFAGISYTASDGTSLGAEYIMEQENNGYIFRKKTVSASLRQPIGKNLMLDLGTTIPFGIGEQTYFAGILYIIDGKDLEGYMD